MKILVIEGEKSLARLLRKKLEKEGFLVDCALSKEDGQRYLGDAKYDAVVLGTYFNEKSCLDFLKEIKGKNPSLPILILTTESDFKEKSALFDAGADAYLPEPFHISEFMVKIKALTRNLGGAFSMQV